jgi:hypothetical protein
MQAGPAGGPRRAAGAGRGARARVRVRGAVGDGQGSVVMKFRAMAWPGLAGSR